MYMPVYMYYENDIGRARSPVVMYSLFPWSDYRHQANINLLSTSFAQRVAKPTLGTGTTTEESVGELRIRISYPTDPIPTFLIHNAHFLFDG